jgi:1-acyl-sn-glycerol-3-phosphate acyltransferase
LVPLLLAGDATPFYRFTQLVLGTGFRVARGVKVEGLEHIPVSGSCLIVANHSSWLDPPVLGCFVPHRQMHFMAKRELFDRPVLGRLIHWLGAFPVERGQADRRSLRIALDLLASGRIVTVFPEGTRSDGVTMGAWNLGMAMLASRADVNIIPAALKHTRDLLEDRKLRQTPRPIRIRFGPPIGLGDMEGNGKARLVQIQSRCHATVQSLLEAMGE